MACDSCVSKDGKIYAPFEGASPKGGRDSWPENFVEELDGWGMYYCPTCKSGLGKARAQQLVLAKRARNAKQETPSIASPGIKASEAAKLNERTDPKNHSWWLIGAICYLIGIFGIWSLSATVGRWVLVTTPIAILVGGAYYFAEGATTEIRGRNFVVNLQKIALAIFGLWLLSKCGGADDGPIDSFFRR